MAASDRMTPHYSLIPSLRSQAQWLFDFWLPENNLVILYKSKYLNKVKQQKTKNILDSLYIYKIIIDDIQHLQ